MILNPDYFLWISGVVGSSQEGTADDCVDDGLLYILLHPPQVLRAHLLNGPSSIVSVHSAACISLLVSTPSFQLARSLYPKSQGLQLTLSSAVWTALEAEGLCCSLQPYDFLPDFLRVWPRNGPFQHYGARSANWCSGRRRAGRIRLRSFCHWRKGSRWW